MKEGSQVIVLGKLDNKIREKATDGLVKGTVFCTLRIEGLEIAVLLENGDIWCGLKREVTLVKDQS